MLREDTCIDGNLRAVTVVKSQSTKKGLMVSECFLEVEKGQYEFGNRFIIFPLKKQTNKFMPKHTERNRSWVITSRADEQGSPLCECREGMLCSTSWKWDNAALLDGCYPERENQKHSVTGMKFFLLCCQDAEGQFGRVWAWMRGISAHNIFHSSFFVHHISLLSLDGCGFDLTSSQVWLKAFFSFLGLLLVCL